jgi:hypothetical protein
MRRADFLAGAIPPGLTKYLCAKIDEELLKAFASGLGTDLLAAPEMPFLTPPSPRTVHSCQLG